MGVFYKRVHEQLTLWTRQLAWLHTAPEIENRGNLPEIPARIKAMRDRGEPILLPPNPAPHITDWLMEIGPSISGTMGEGAIGWADLTAWQEITGIELEPWEGRLLRDLSSAFVSGRQEARKANCPAPYSGDSPSVINDRVTEQFKAMFAALQSRSK